MCTTESSITALQYLQTEVSSVVNHTSEEESAAFQKLLTFLLNQPMSPMKDAPSPLPPMNGASHVHSDLDLENETGVNGANRGDRDVEMGSQGHGGDIDKEQDDELRKQRLVCFDAILEFVDPKAKQPKADLVDLVKLQIL